MTDRGVFYDDCLQEGGEVTKSMRWKPVHELAGPNKPSSLGPALPFRFMANELAAFMLWGWWGSQFQSFFGPLNYGPNEFVLNGDHEDAADGYEALKRANVIYSDAQHVVGELDQQDREHALDMLDQFNNACSQAYAHEGVMEREDGSLEFDDDIPRLEYFQRIARAKESVAAQKALLKQANKQADATERTWRTAMVRQLLQTQAVTPSPAPVARETVEQRCARYLALFEAEERREKRGALQRVADSEKVDRSNMRKDINKARAERDAQKRAGGGWASQLVQDGKRTG